MCRVDARAGRVCFCVCDPPGLSSKHFLEEEGGEGGFGSCTFLSSDTQRTPSSVLEASLDILSPSLCGLGRDKSPPPRQNHSPRPVSPTGGAFPSSPGQEGEDGPCLGWGFRRVCGAGTYPLHPELQLPAVVAQIALTLVFPKAQGDYVRG